MDQSFPPLPREARFVHSLEKGLRGVSGRMLRPDFIEATAAFEIVFHGNTEAKNRYNQVAKEKEWGFEMPSEDKEVPSVRYIPFGELRDWLLEHARNGADDDAILEADYEGAAASMKEAWLQTLNEPWQRVNALKRTYEEFLDKVSLPVIQRKRAKVDEINLY